MVTTRRVRSALLAGLAVIGALGATATAPAPGGAAPLPACTRSWVAPTDGSWEEPARWSGGQLPGPEDHVCITVAGDYTVTYGTSGLGGVASLRVGATSGSASGTQALRIASDAEQLPTSLTADAGVEVSPRGRIRMDRFASEAPPFGTEVTLAVGGGAIIANAGVIELPADDAMTVHLGDLATTGTLDARTSLEVEGDLTNDGTLQVLGGRLHVEGTLWTRSGTGTGRRDVHAEDLRVGAMEAAFTDSTGLTFVVRDGRIAFDEGAGGAGAGAGAHRIVVQGDTTVSGRPRPAHQILVAAQGGTPATLRFAGTWTSGAWVELQPSATADATLAGTAPGDRFVNEGSVLRFPQAGAGAVIAADVLNRGSLSAFGGLLDVAGDVRNEHVLTAEGVRGYVGEVRIDGDLDLGPGGRVVHVIPAVGEVDGGRITATGAVHLDGTVWVSSDTPTPAVGATSPVVTGASRTGTFAEIRFLGFASYDPAYSGTGVALVRRASEPPTHRLVRAAFQDFLRRQPTDEELAARAAAIDEGRATQTTLVRSLATSPQYATTLVQRFYADTLGRAGDAEGVAFWVGQIRTGRRTVAEVAASFYASAEYVDRVGGTPGAWIDDLYEVLLGRAAVATDRAYWVGRAEARGRTRVALELYQSLESRRARVDRLYRALLLRPGDPGGLAYWAGRLTAEGDIVLAVALASSAEYRDGAQRRYP